LTFFSCDSTDSHISGTAVFVTAYPQCIDSKFSPSAEIQSLDLGKPVLDFTVDAQGLVWVCIDVNWNKYSEEVVSVRLGKIQSDGKASITLLCKAIGTDDVFSSLKYLQQRSRNIGKRSFRL
jgi:hypothetical protein